MAADEDANDPEAFFDARDYFDAASQPPSPGTSSPSPTATLRHRRRRSFSKIETSILPSTSYIISPESTLTEIPSSSLLDEVTSPAIELSQEESKIDSLENGLLVSMAGFVIKAVVFQIGLLVSSVKFPIWLIYSSFSFVTDPLGTLELLRNRIKVLLMSVSSYSIGMVAPLFPWRIGSSWSASKTAIRVAWGLCWGIYVCFLLLGFMAMAFFSARLLVGWVVEEPLVVHEELSFDYTKESPDSVVWLMPFDEGGGCGLDISGAGKHVGYPLLLPPNHNLWITISLTLPESEYNRKLGMFQVRTELLSSSGKITFSSRRPCMLQYKSPHILLVETFLKSFTLLTGYSSESQNLRLSMKGRTKGSEPTACARVILEQRAEYRPGSGIPEIYSASLRIESKLPFFKSVVWSWKMTLFIWVSLAIFVFELLAILSCCRQVIIPKVSLFGVSSSTDGS